MARNERDRLHPRFENVDQALIGMKCAVVRSGGEVVPTNAGMVFFGRYPQQHVIQDEVVCVLFRDAVGASRYADRKILTAPFKSSSMGPRRF